MATSALLALFVVTGAFSLLVPGPLVWREVDQTNTPDARHENAFIEVGGKFYLLGGRSTRRVEIYDPSDSTWTNGAFPPLSISLHHFQAVAIGTTIYVVGAYTESYPDEVTVPNIYTYNTTNNTWSTGSAIPTEFQRGSAAAVVYNGNIYLVGGSVGGHGGSAVRKKDFSMYNPNTNTWTALTQAPRARDHFHATVHGHKLYVAGGRDGSNPDNIAPVDVYNFNSGFWSTLSNNIPTPRGGTTSVTLGDYVLVIGGETSQQLAHDEVEALNVLTGDWLELNPLVTGRHGMQAIVYGDDLFVVAGSGEKGGGPELTSLETYETSGETTLPVELAPGFEAVVDGGSIHLHWETLSETNNAGFEVQQDVDGRFETLGFVPGFGTTTIHQKYTYTVNHATPGRHRFRLRQVDFDGAFVLSPVAHALIDLLGSHYLGEVYPNPFNPEARFVLTVPREQQVKIEIYDLLGRQQKTLFDGMILAQEPTSFTIQSDGLAGGRYLLRVVGESFTDSQVITLLK
ncbi:MAG: kelch repeat-containing protein [Rhodothermales bacterium]|nr:kelch repeat-containing protein [Rhodothermales bacterium]